MNAELGSKIQILFICLITLQFLVVSLHDLIDVPDQTTATQVQAIAERLKLWLSTSVNALFPGLAVAFGIYFWNSRKPGFVLTYWVLYSAVTLASATAMR